MITSVSLGDTVLTNSKRALLSIKNLAFPEVSYTSAKRGGFIGQTIRGGNIVAPKFGMEWMIFGSSFSDLATERDTFLSLLGEVISAGGKTLKINKSNSVNIQTDIKRIGVTGDIAAEDGLSGTLLIDVEAEYPFLLSQTLNSEDSGIYSGGGMAIPMAIPMSMAEGGNNEMVLANAGTYKSYPVLTFYGPLNTPSITNLTTGETLNINYNIGASNYLVVDTLLRTALLYSGGVNMRQYLSGDFITLAKGNNILHLSAASYNTTGRVNVSWRDAYLGL